MSGKRALLVTSAVASDPKKINEGYYVKNLCQQLDYISVMTYDYHGGTWDDRTGLNSPLYSRDAERGIKDDTTIAKWKNANFSISYWISNGCPPAKINLGLAAYGKFNKIYCRDESICSKDCNQKFEQNSLIINCIVLGNFSIMNSFIVKCH